MPPVGFEPTISAGERPQTYALERAATGTGQILTLTAQKRKVNLPLNAVTQALCTETGTEGWNKYNNHIVGLRTVARAMARRGLLGGNGHGVPCRNVVFSCLKMEAVFFFLTSVIIYEDSRRDITKTAT